MTFILCYILSCISIIAYENLQERRKENPMCMFHSKMKRLLCTGMCHPTEHVDGPTVLAKHPWQKAPLTLAHTGPCEGCQQLVTGFSIIFADSRNISQWHQDLQLQEPGNLPRFNMNFFMIMQDMTIDLWRQGDVSWSITNAELISASSPDLIQVLRYQCLQLWMTDSREI